MSLTCSIGIMAHNEESNIGRLLDALVSQRTSNVAVREIVVVASGCTDGTETIVNDWVGKDPRIRLITQAKREGKASAANQFLREAQENILVLCSADLLPVSNAIEQLVAPFGDSEVGLTCGRPLPVNQRNTLMGFAAHFLWDLHHQVNLRSFKAGELIAFRKTFTRIPYQTAVDEASMEPIIRGQGYKVRYVPTALVYNKGPETAAEFLIQRRRIFAGHLAIRDAVGYRVSTMGVRTILPLVLRNLNWHPRRFFWTWAVIGLEAYARLLGWNDYRKRLDHSVWKIASSTKNVNEVPRRQQNYAGGSVSTRKVAG